jgi:hypothetical protein
MFAPKVAKPQTKTESPSARLAPQCSTLAGHRLGHDSLEQPLLLQRAIGNQATLPVIVQPKLEIGAVDDPLEHEADRVADQVMCMPGQVARDGLLQRKCSRCEEEDKLQRWSTSAPVRETAGGATVHEEADQGAALPLADLGEDLAASRGHPLDPATRTFMESRFGYDFSRVRLHADEAAAASARSLDARAFAVGRNIFFGPGEHAPGRIDGQRLLAHELTHVLQQTGRLGRPALMPRVIQRQTVEGSPAPTEKGQESSEDVAKEEGATDELEALVIAARNAGRKNAAEVLERVATFNPLPEAIARLDDKDEALGHLLRVLGPDAWLPENRKNLLAILPLRTPEHNVETIRNEIDTGLLKRDFGVSPDEAHLAYEVFKAMSEADRARFLQTPEGQLAFEKVGERTSCELRVSRDFGFYDADIEALLAELEKLDTWSEDQRTWLRTVFAMIVQGGHADDPRVQRFVQHNWELQPEYFAGLGFDEKGEITPEELRDTPNPRWIGWITKVFLTGVWAGQLLGTVKLGLQFVGGKRSHVQGLPVADLPLGSVLHGLGGSLSGIDLADIPGIEDSGLASVSIDKKEGVFILDVTSAAIPTVDLTGKGEAGATLTVTAMNGTFGDLHVEARWPAEGNPAELPDLRAQVGSLSLDTAVLSAGNLLVGADRLTLQALEFDSPISAASENGRFRMRKFLGNLQSQLAAVISVVESALFAVATTVLGQQRSPDETEVRDADWFARVLHETLAAKFNSAMLSHVSVASVVAEGVVFASGESFERVATSLDLTIAAGPRTLASLEMARIEEGAPDRQLTPGEQTRMDNLMRVAASDQAEAREGIKALGMDPDAVELRLNLGSPDSKEAISVAGINVSGMVQSPGTISPERATIELRFPGDSVRIPADADSDAQGRALFTLELDAPGELKTSKDLQLAGLPPLGPITVEGASGEATVREDGVVSLDVVLPKVEFEGVRSTITVDAEEGVAQGVHVVADVVMDPTRRLGIQRIDNCGVFIEMITAKNVVMERPGAWRMEVLDPVLNGLKLTAGLIDGKLVAKTLYVGPGRVSGLEASLGTLLKASSRGVLSFGGIDIEEIVPYKRHGFTIADLDANQVQIEAGDQAVRIERFDGKEVKGELALELETGDLSDIEFSISGGSVDLGALDLTFPWGRVTARSASLPSFSATAKITIENPGGDAPESLSLIINAVDSPTVNAEGLGFELRRTGVRGWLEQPGALEGLKIRDIGLTLDAKGITAKGGTVTVDRSRMAGLETWVRDVAFAGTSASTGKLSFEFFSDGTGGRFGVEDLKVDSKGWVQVKNGQRGSFVLEAFTAGVVEGAVTEKGIEAKIPVSRLDLGPVDFTYAGVHMKCASASAPELLLTVRVAAGKASAGGEAPLQITLEHAEAPLVNVEGLEFEFLSLGVRGRLPNHPGVLEGVTLDGVEAVLTPQGFTLESGTATMNRTEASGALVTVANLLSGRVNAGTGAVTVEFFSDQQVKFGAEDITVEADGKVTVATGNPGKFLLVTGSVRSIEGELSPAGIEGVARGILLGPGSYDDGNLQLTFQNMKLDAAFSKGKLALDAYHLLSPSLHTVLEAKGIGTILGIDLESATIHIKDVWSLPGAGNPLDPSRLEGLKALARGASGELTGRVVSGEDLGHANLEATVRDGVATGRLSDIYVSNPVPPRYLSLSKPFQLDLVTLLGSAKDFADALDAMSEAVAPQPVGEPSQAETLLNRVLQKAEFHDINGRLDIRLETIPIGNLGYLYAARQSTPQVSLVLSGDTATELQVKFSFGTLSLDSVVWNLFVSSMQGVVIDEAQVRVTFDGLIPRSISGNIQKGHIDALKLFGPPPEPIAGAH